MSWRNPTLVMKNQVSISTIRQCFPKDDTIALSRDCLVGPEVWRERFLHKGTFLSDRLAPGLKEAGLARKFKLVRCRVI